MEVLPYIGSITGMWSEGSLGVAALRRIGE